ncbi:acyltransferase [Thalassovita mediterranea]|nr:acyltransferase [Thalassovita mediterranea]
MGKNTYFNKGALIDSRHCIEIGDGVAVGPNCYIADYDHSFEMNENGNRIDDGLQEAVTIGENVWVGANVCILKGVRIGARSIVGAGSVVTKNLPPDVVAVGSPAKPVRFLALPAKNTNQSGALAQ